MLTCVCNVVIVVKYLREVTPYFRKSSALNDVGWNSDSPEVVPQPTSPQAAQMSDKRTIPLKLCYLCRNLTMPDPQNRTIELHSPDGMYGKMGLAIQHVNQTLFIKP